MTTAMWEGTPRQIGDQESTFRNSWEFIYSDLPLICALFGSVIYMTPLIVEKVLLRNVNLDKSIDPSSSGKIDPSGSEAWTEA